MDEPEAPIVQGEPTKSINDGFFIGEAADNQASIEPAPSETILEDLVEQAIADELGENDGVLELETKYTETIEETLTPEQTQSEEQDHNALEKIARESQVAADNTALAEIVEPEEIDEDIVDLSPPDMTEKLSLLTKNWRGNRFSSGRACTTLEGKTG